jgi:tetratricopeptide (TPR) repeat protein
MLSLNELQNIVLWINSQSELSMGDQQQTMIPNLSIDDVSHLLMRFLMAAQCLFKLEKYEDCLGLLDLIISLEDIHPAYPYHLLCRLRDIDGKINPFASLLYVAGKCFDALENRPEAIRYLVLSIKIDPTCLHAMDYLLEKKLLTEKERRDLYDQLPMLNGDLEYLNYFYRYASLSYPRESVV